MMGGSAGPRLRSTRDLEVLSQVAGHIVYSGEGASGQQLLVRVFAHGGDGHLAVPEVAEDALIIITNHVRRSDGKIARRFQGCRPGPGDMFIVPRGLPSEWQWAGQCNVIQLSPSPELVMRVAVEALDVEPARAELLPRIAHHDPLVYELGRAKLAELRGDRPASRLYLDLLSQTLVMHLLRHHAALDAPTQRPAGGLSREALRRVTDYVMEHLADDLRLADLARVANLSQYHFARMFRQATGLSVHRYVMERRLEQAARLLAEGLTLAEVAARTGFADQSHLARRYRARFGVSARADAQRRT